MNYGGRYYAVEEMVNLVGSSLDFWLTAGLSANKSEKHSAEWMVLSIVQLLTMLLVPTYLHFTSLLLLSLGIVLSSVVIDGLKICNGFILPIAEINLNPSWFGFFIAVKKYAVSFVMNSQSV